MRNKLNTNNLQTADTLNRLILSLDAAYALLEAIREQCGHDDMTRDAVYGVQALVGSIACDLSNLKEGATV